MKKICFKITILFITINILKSQEQPIFNWEEINSFDQYRFVEIKELKFDSGSYLITLSGQHLTKGSLKNPGRMEFDIDGKLTDKMGKSMLSDNPVSLSNKTADRYKFYSDPKQFSQILNLNFNGDSVEVQKSELVNGFATTCSVPILSGDTIIQCFRKFDSDKWYYYFFDWELKTNKIIEFDSFISEDTIATYLLSQIYNPAENEIIHLVGGPQSNIEGVFPYSYVMKYDLQGKQLWKTKISLENNQKMEVKSVLKNTNNNYIVVCMPVTGEKKELLFIEINSNGEIVSKKYAEKGLGTKFSTTFHENVNKFSNNRIIVFGYRDINPETLTFINFLYIYNSAGETIRKLEWEGKPYYPYNRPYIQKILESPDGNLIVAGALSDSLFIGEINLTTVSVNEKFHNQSKITISPNPATDFIAIQISEGFEISDGYKVQIFDILGIEVMSEEIHPITQSHRMNIERLPAGVYYIKIGSKEEKFVKM